MNGEVKLEIIQDEVGDKIIKMNNCSFSPKTSTWLLTIHSICDTPQYSKMILECWLYFLKRLSDKQSEMNPNRCSRKRSNVVKINILLVYTSLCCSLCGTYFLRVPSANVSLLLELFSAFIVTPQWNCDSPLRTRGHHPAQLCSVQQSASISFSLWVITSCYPLVFFYFFLIRSM